MSAMSQRAFLSYRRDDTSGYAGRIYDRLQQRFPNQIFMDVSGIDAGVDFVDSIEREVRSSSVLVALIGKHWLDGERLEDPEDFVNREIALALENKIPIIPVLLRGARMPSAVELPESLKPLSRRNAVEIGEATFDRDMAALISALQPRLRLKTAVSWRWIAALCAFILIAIAGSSAVILKNVWPPATPTPSPSPGPGPSRATDVSPAPNISTPSSSGAFVFEPIGKWSVSTGGATAGSMLLDLKQDQSYEISNTNGTFQQLAAVIGSRGTWTFNRSDMSLTILGTGSRYGFGMRITQKLNNGFSAVGVDGVPYTFAPAPP